MAPRLAAWLKTGLMPRGSGRWSLTRSERLLLATNTLPRWRPSEHRGLPSQQTSDRYGKTGRSPRARRRLPKKYREGQVESVAVTIDEWRSHCPGRCVEGRGLQGRGPGRARRSSPAAEDWAGGRVCGAGGAAWPGPARSGATRRGKWSRLDRQGPLGGCAGTSTSARPDARCGIRGAIQHRLGMKGNKCVVAINTDPAAPFFPLRRLWAGGGLPGDRSCPGQRTGVGVGFVHGWRGLPLACRFRSPLEPPVADESLRALSAVVVRHASASATRRPTPGVAHQRQRTSCGLRWAG